jgi:hypothetical protein
MALKYYILFIIALSYTSVNWTQKPGGKGEISGSVIDASSKVSMSYVTSTLYKIQDSSMVTGAITNSEGEFKLKDVPFGNYYLKLSFIGYKPKFISDISLNKEQPSRDFNNISLSSDDEILESVEIVGEKPMVVYEIDKKVVNVEDMVTVASGTALDVLQNVPSITVDIDGNVSLRGSTGFTLFIDNKPVNMDVNDALQMIPASNIKDIEIITNPSAMYNAEGTSGIINIILKKNKLEGISTLINLNGGNFDNYSGDFLTSINKDKIKFNIGGNVRLTNRYRDIVQERRTELAEQTSIVQSEGLHRFQRNNISLNTALEWTPNRKNSFSISLMGNNRQFNAFSDYDFKEFLGDSLTAAYNNVESTVRDFYGVTTSGSYEHLFKGDKEHRLVLMGMYNLNDGNEDALVEFYNMDNVLQGAFRGTEVGPMNLFRFNVDYELPLKNKKKFKTGLQADLGNNKDDQNNYVYNTALEEFERMDLFSSNVSYLQNVYAGYAILNGKLKEKLGYQFGLRTEYIDRNIFIETGTEELNLQKLDWFPSAHFSYQMDDNNQFMMSGSRRINRPRTWFLEPFITWEDPYTVRQGNPDLLQEYIQSYEIGYIRNLKKGSFSTEIYYRNTSNIIQRIQEVYDTNVIVKRPINAGSSNAMGSEIAYRKTLKKWWSLDAGINLFWYQFRGGVSDLVLNQDIFTYNTRVANTFTIKDDWKIQLVGRYTSLELNAQGRTNEYYTVDLAIKKDFWDRKLSTTLQVNNILNTEVKESFIETSSLYSYRLETPMWPVFTISASLRLNNYNQQDKIKVVEGADF